MTSEFSFNNLTAAQSFSLRPPLINFKVLPQTHLFDLFRRLSNDFIPFLHLLVFNPPWCQAVLLAVPSL